MDLKKILKPFCVSDGKKFSLKNHDPPVPRALPPRRQAKRSYAAELEWLAAEQSKLYAQDRCRSC
jgi:hypothetical protein